jgi:SRSO17 transposase
MRRLIGPVGLNGLVEQIAPRFGRIEPRRQVRVYLRGLLAAVERENGWQLAQRAGDRAPGGVRDCLARMRWDEDAVLVLGEIGSVKKGAKSVGVRRQDLGTCAFNHRA